MNPLFFYIEKSAFTVAFAKQYYIINQGRDCWIISGKMVENLRWLTPLQVPESEDHKAS